MTSGTRLSLIFKKSSYQRCDFCTQIALRMIMEKKNKNKNKPINRMKVILISYDNLHNDIV